VTAEVVRIECLDGMPIDGYTPDDEERFRVSLRVVYAGHRDGKEISTLVHAWSAAWITDRVAAGEPIFTRGGLVLRRRDLAAIRERLTLIGREIEGGPLGTVGRALGMRLDLEHPWRIRDGRSGLILALAIGSVVCVWSGFGAALLFAVAESLARVTSLLGYLPFLAVSAFPVTALALAVGDHRNGAPRSWSSMIVSVIATLIMLASWVVLASFLQDGGWGAGGGFVD
jgi:hypothetical protein